MVDSKIYAEDVNYFRTSKSGADTWLERAKAEIKRVGGQVVGSGSFTEDISGRAGFMLAFRLDDDDFTVKWPVLQSKTNQHRAARVQAATALYHEIKNACVKLRFLGARSAFLPYLMLPDGRTAAEVTSSQLLEALPAIVGGNQQLLED